MAADVGRAGEFIRGWRILLGATLGVAVGISALPFYTGGVFVKPLEAEFGWTREQIALGSLASTFTVAFVSPWVGALVDRFGVRIPAVLGLLFLSLGFVALSRMPGSIGVFVAIQVAVAVLAASSSPLTFTRVVNAWFERSKGLALGLTLAGIGVTAALAPGLVSAIVAEDGWRSGYLTLAAVAAVAAPIVFLLLGAKCERPPTAPGAVAAPVVGMPFAAAVRSTVFWRLVAAFLLLAGGGGGLGAAPHPHAGGERADPGGGGRSAGRAGTVGPRRTTDHRLPGGPHLRAPRGRRDAASGGGRGGSARLRWP
jgi:MFS family permease